MLQNRSVLSPPPYRTTSDVDGPVVDRQRGLLERLGQARVRVARAGDVLRRRAELDSSHRLRDEVARAGTETRSRLGSQTAVSQPPYTQPVSRPIAWFRF